MIIEDWQAKFQLVPPNVHRRNVAKCAICTLKAHFLSVLASVNPYFLKYMWYQLLVQTELTLNLLRKSTLNPYISVWEDFNGTFDFTGTLLVPLGIKVVIHDTAITRNSWDQQGRDGFYIGPSFVHYFCLSVIFDERWAALIGI